MSFAAIIPAVMQIASGAASGAAAMEQNAANKRTKHTLLEEAAQLRRLGAPLGKGLVAGYLPGGDLSRVLEGQGVGDAAQAARQTAQEETRDAWRYGGPGYGRSHGYLASSPYRYLMASSAARASGRTTADKALADLYLARRDAPGRATVDPRAQLLQLASGVFTDFSKANYGQ